MISRSLLKFRIISITFWIMATFQFVAQELLPPLLKGTPAVALAADAVILIIGLLSIRTARQVMLLASFLIIGAISTFILAGYGWTNFINGSRDFWPILFCPFIFKNMMTGCNHQYIRRSIDKQLKVFLFIQMPCITWQFIRYGANDHGGGSLGNGFTGIISILIFLLSFYFIKQNFDSREYLLSLKRNWIYVVALYPVMLNETKVSFIFMAIYFLLLFAPEIRSIGKLIIAVPVAALMFSGLYALYISVTGQQDKDIASGEYLNTYLMTNGAEDIVEDIQNLMDVDPDDYNTEAIDLPRFAKFTMLPFVLDESTGGQWFGAGFGQYKGGTVLKRTKFAEDNRWFMQGTTTTLLFIPVQIGWLGFIWFIVVLIFLINFKKRAGKMAMQFKLLLALTSLIIIFYNESFETILFCMIFSYLCLTTWIPENPDDEQPNDQGAIDTDLTEHTARIGRQV